MVHLDDLWFIIIAIFWVGFFVLEGFDFGVGMLHSFVGQHRRRAARCAINAIGPFWDGNEVWLIVAGGGHVRRLPGLVRHHVLHLLPGAAVVLVALMARGVSFEYQPQDRRPALAHAVALVPHHRQPARPVAARHRPRRHAARLPIDKSGNYTGTLLGAAAAVRPLHRGHAHVVCCSSGPTFLAPEDHGTCTTGRPAGRPAGLAGRRWSPSVSWSGATSRSAAASCRTRSMPWPSWPSSAPPGPPSRATGLGLRRRRHSASPAWCGRCSSTCTRRVMVSPPTPPTTSPSPTQPRAPYTLQVMTVVAAIFFPLVLAYQGWTFHVSRPACSHHPSPPPRREPGHARGGAGRDVTVHRPFTCPGRSAERGHPEWVMRWRVIFRTLQCSDAPH